MFKLLLLFLKVAEGDSFLEVYLHISKSVKTIAELEGGGGGGLPCPFSKIGKKCPNLGKKMH